MSKNRLTLKQEKFVREYVKNGNASRAVKEAYPNVKSNGGRRVMGSKLVTNANVNKRIQEILSEAGLTPELITKELKELIIGDDKSEKNKAIRTASEIMGLIGKGGLISTQVSIGNRAMDINSMGIFPLLELKESIEERIKELSEKVNLSELPELI
ncbi:MAG: hypothetical protein FJZ16_08290 [Candidatus Omnitrophica bacterium]|nr:hypothetical protein [Candidatus Omnitrophota bacterium]